MSSWHGTFSLVTTLGPGGAAGERNAGRVGVRDEHCSAWEDMMTAGSWKQDWKDVKVDFKEATGKSKPTR